MNVLDLVLAEMPAEIESVARIEIAKPQSFGFNSERKNILAPLLNFRFRSIGEFFALLFRGLVGDRFLEFFDEVMIILGDGDHFRKELPRFINGENL